MKWMFEYNRHDLTYSCLHVQESPSTEYKNKYYRNLPQQINLNDYDTETLDQAFEVNVLPKMLNPSANLQGL